MKTSESRKKRENELGLRSKKKRRGWRIKGLAYSGNMRRSKTRKRRLRWGVHLFDEEHFITLPSLLLRASCTGLLSNSFLYSLQHRLENQSLIHEPKTQHQEEEKRVRQEQEIEQKVPESSRDREEKKTQLNYEVQCAWKDIGTVACSFI